MKRDNLFGILWDIAFISAFILSSSFANALCGDSVCENRSALASFIITEGENAFFYNLTIRQSLDYRNNITNNSFTIILRDANDKWNNLLIFQEGNGIINATKGIPVSINENISLLVYSLNWTNEKDTCPEDCITQQICGDSICDSSESLNCCIDCGCSDGINCIGNVCTPPTNNSFVPVNPPFPEPNSPNKLPFTLLLAGGIFAVVVVVGSTAGIVSHKKNKEKKKEEYYKKMLLQKYIHLIGIILYSQGKIMCILNIKTLIRADNLMFMPTKIHHRIILHSRRSNRAHITPLDTHKNNFIGFTQVSSKRIKEENYPFKT